MTNGQLVLPTALPGSYWVTVHGHGTITEGVRFLIVEERDDGLLVGWKDGVKPRFSGALLRQDQIERDEPTWSKTFLEIEYADDVFLSVVFTWDLPLAYQRAVWYNTLGKRVHAGGPAVTLIPEYLAGVAEMGRKLPGALQLHNPYATRTSTGCPRGCLFCAVPRIEGDLVELTNWPVNPVVIDNNLLACSQAHFDRVVDRLKPVPNVDFNQGLDARLLTKHHADRLTELDLQWVRLAFDHTGMERDLLRAINLLRAAGVPKDKIGVYVLIGFDDTPDDALYRLQKVHGMGIDPFSMRYNPLGAMMRDVYVAPTWTNWQLKKFMRYWSNLRFFRAVPFEDFDETM